jgi:hypothetical protein
MDIQSFIDNTSMLRNGAALAWSHAAGSEGVPSSLNMAFNCNCEHIYNKEM